MVIPNSWCVYNNSLRDALTDYSRLLTVDADLYPNPESFHPERFVGVSAEKAELLDPRNIVFGYGRR